MAAHVLRARAWGRRGRVWEAPLTTNRDPHTWGVGFQRCQMASRSKRWLPVALLMACAVSVHGMGRARAAHEVAEEMSELQHKQLEKQYGEVLTNNQVSLSPGGPHRSVQWHQSQISCLPLSAPIHILLQVGRCSVIIGATPARSKRHCVTFHLASRAFGLGSASQ